MIFPMKYNKYGYVYCSNIGGGKYHTGTDFNWGSGSDDLGFSVYAIFKGKVIAKYKNAGGWGNVLIVEHPELKIWCRYAHLKDVYKNPGDILKEGQTIATCGKSGTTSPHLHFDIIKQKLPKGWLDYSANISIANVKKYYENPIEYINNYNKSMDNKDEKVIKWISETGIITEGWDNPNQPMTQMRTAHFGVKLYDLLHSQIVSLEKQIEELKKQINK